MRNWRNLLVLAAPLLLAGCFFLPGTVSGIADSKKLDSLIIVDAQSVSFEAAANLGLPERLMLTSNTNTDSVNLKKGKEMDSDTAREQAISELKRFLGDSPFEFDFENLAEAESAAYFIIDSEDPMINMIVWGVSLSDQFGRAVTVRLDDETGIILHLFYRKIDKKPYINNNIISGNSAYLFPQDDSLYSEAELLTEMMAAYYGLPVELGDYKNSGDFAYYRADLTTDSEVIPMYGVVRETSFSMNE